MHYNHSGVWGLCAKAAKIIIIRICERRKCGSTVAIMALRSQGDSQELWAAEELGAELYSDHVEHHNIRPVALIAVQGRNLYAAVRNLAPVNLEADDGAQQSALGFVWDEYFTVLRRQWGFC